MIRGTSGFESHQSHQALPKGGQVEDAENWAERYVRGFNSLRSTQPYRSRMVLAR